MCQLPFEHEQAAGWAPANERIALVAAVRMPSPLVLAAGWRFPRRLYRRLLGERVQVMADRQPDGCCLAVRDLLQTEGLSRFWVPRHREDLGTAAARGFPELAHLLMEYEVLEKWQQALTSYPTWSRDEQSAGAAAADTIGRGTLEAWVVAVSELVGQRRPASRALIAARRQRCR